MSRLVRLFPVPLVVAAVSVMLGILAVPLVYAAPKMLTLSPGDRLTVNCSTSLQVQSQQSTQLVVDCAAPTPAATAAPTSTPTPQHGAGKCGESNDLWHPPVVNGCATGHEHGDAPPQWVLDSGNTPMFSHAANTPNENVLKHTGFKAFGANMNGIDVYVIMHLDSNPNGHTSRFHSYQMWARDPQGGVSHWHGWLDFGQGNNTGPNLRRIGCDDTNVRPIMAVNDEGCGPVKFESWYSRAGQADWMPDFGINLKPQYFTGGDINDPSTWAPTGNLNDVRRLEVAWYTSRTNRRGHFWATNFGEVVSGQTDPVCGTTRTIGAKTYPVLCLEQHIAPTMPTLGFPGNSVQKTYDVTGVVLPN